MWGFIEKYLPVSLYVHVGCTPMKIMFYFHSSWCSCCTPIPASLQMALWCLLPNHLLMLSLVTGQTDVLSGEKFLPSEALQLFWEDTHPHPHPPPPAPRNDSLHPRCPVVWWTLTVWKSLSRDHYVLRWQEAVGPGNVLKSRGCGENSSVCRTLRQKSTVNAVSCELALELEHHQMKFQESVFERLVLWSVVSHHSQRSAANQFVVGRSIVGEVWSRSPKACTSPLCSDSVWGKCWLDLYSSSFPELCRIFWNSPQFCFMASSGHLWWCKHQGLPCEIVHQ